LKKTIPLIISLLFVVCAITPLGAQDTVHTVKKGDTLWDITKMYLETPWKWPIVWANNQDITNPHLIFPGDRVVISKNGDRTTITIIPAKQAGTETVSTPKEITDTKGKSIVVSPQYSTYFYSPTPLSGSGTVLKKMGVGDFSSTNESVIIKSKSGLAPNSGINIVSKIAEIKDKDKVAGYLYKTVAIAWIDEAQGDFFKAAIKYSNQEVREGDVVLDDLGSIHPIAMNLFEPSLKGAGRVIDLVGGVSGSCYLDLVFLNIGKADGVEQGALINLYREEELKEEKTVIKEYQGMALVLQSLDTSSMALVIESIGPIQRDFIAAGLK